jgi:hypothetical protein
LAVSLAYPSGKEGGNFLVQIFLPALLRVEKGGGSAPYG